MVKALSLDLRRRVVNAIERGLSCRQRGGMACPYWVIQFEC